ncbi:MAG: hypothetical protein ACRC0L_07750 [Angustibacter sp.]
MTVPPHRRSDDPENTGHHEPDDTDASPDGVVDHVDAPSDAWERGILIVEDSWVPQDFNDMCQELSIKRPLGDRVSPDDPVTHALVEDCPPGDDCGYDVVVGRTGIRYISTHAQWVLTHKEDVADE